MEFKVLDWFKKKSATATTPIPQLWEDTNFYTIEGTTEQNTAALILMYNDLPEFQAPINYIIDSLSIIPYAHMRNDKVVNDSKIKALLNNIDSKFMVVCVFNFKL